MIVSIEAVLLAALGLLGAAPARTHPVTTDPVATEPVAPIEPTARALPGQALIAELARRLFAELELHRPALARDPQVVVLLVDPLLAPHFDASYTARLALGAHWRTASEEQQRRFAVALYRTLLRTYAEAIADWAPDRFRLLPHADDAAALQVLVRTEVSQRSGVVAHVDYRLRSTAEGWKIFDVLVDGVSYVHSYHTDLDAEVATTGLEAAIVRLEHRDGGKRRPAPR